MQCYKMIKRKGNNVTGDQKTKQNKKTKTGKKYTKRKCGCTLGGEAIGIIFQNAFIQKAL